MKIVINSSPLIALSCINQLNLLDKLFDEVIIPQAVYKETVIDGNDKKIDNDIKQLKYFKILQVADSRTLEFIIDVLDVGEAEVIALAKELKVNTVVIDELKGRKYARKHNLETIGSLGILVLGKKKGLIKEVSPLLQKMLDCGIRISNKLKEEILRKVDEI